MKKINVLNVLNVFKGKKILAVGLLSAAVVWGANTAMAAGDSASGRTAEGTAVDEQGAEEIALKDANKTADQAERLRTKAEREDGEAVYEITFSVDGIEYEYLIREADGSILEWEIDGRDIGDAAAEESLKNGAEETADTQAETSSAESTDTLIGLDRAKEIALTDAGLDAADVSFSKIKFEKDKREVAYEVEFYQGRQEYEYTIDAYTGEILEMEQDD